MRGSPSSESDLTGTLLERSNVTFSPLECNSNLNQQTCQPWTSVFGSDSDGNNIFNRRVVVPCGECIVMDRGLRNLIFNDGLDIQGKLIFPPNLEIKVKTTSILVQGELHMFANKAIDGLPSITVAWMDPPEGASSWSLGSKSFRQSSPHFRRYPCGQLDWGDCDMGERPFVVAGGKVVIQGLPSADMPTWVPVLDIDNSKTGWHVEKSEFEAYMEPHPSCPSDGILIHHRFHERPPEYVSGFSAEWTGRSLLISKQTDSVHAFIVNTKSVQDCLLPKVTYILTVQVRMPNGKGLTSCAAIGRNCISLFSKYKSKANGKEIVERIWTENESHQFEYGKDLTIHAYVAFVPRDSVAGDHEFHIYGPSTNEDFELLEFTLVTPPREAFVSPQNICSDLVPGNSKAELFDFSPFPFRTNSDYVQIRTKSENSNNYFAVTGRSFVSIDPKLKMEENWSLLGILWHIPPSCIRAKATYRFRAKVRVHSETPIRIKWIVQGWEGRHPVFSPLALCPPSTGEWVQCSGSIIHFPNEIVHSHRLEILAETLDTFRDDYDVDDLSFELIEGPVDRLILPRSIHQKWRSGAHLLITSSSSTWNEWEVVEIKDIVLHNSDSVKVELSRPIKSPVTSRESPAFATEVALLSRNIVFENAGHFTVFHTQGVAQMIEGADFIRFGIAGQPGRYPIFFDDCRDAEGTIVSKNTIRHARNRGLVLHATSNIRVTSNVVFNTTGHSFVLESGKEQGNLFEGNLAVYTTAAMPRISSAGDGNSDDHPAAFWISNPANNFVGNVATGANGDGFSFRFEPLPFDEPDFPVNTWALGIFEDNAIHSVSGSAVHISGYHPHSAMMVGLRAFLVDGDRFELVDSDRITIINGMFDKRVSSAKGISFENPSIIDVRGCVDRDEDAIATMNALVDKANRRPPLTTPTAPSVFGLQEDDR